MIAATLIALLAVPAVSFGHSSANSTSAGQLCKAQRKAMGKKAFNDLYGTNKKKTNGFGKCVSKMTKQQSADKKNAAKDCKAERAAIGEKAFKDKYGTNKNKSNAFGNCVSQKAKEKDDQQQQSIINAAKICKAERAQIGKQAFKDKYGTNKNKSNAFGKCVSQHAKSK
jgi:hypothetical protein